MKKIVFIDWNRTLSYDLFWGHLQDSSHPSHHHLAPIERWLFTDNRDLIGPWMRGEYDVHDIIRRMSNDTSIAEDILLRELRHSCEVMRFCIADLGSLIDAIRERGILVAIATDNMDTFTKFTVPALGLTEMFDAILNSYDVSYLKDDPEPADSIPFFDAFLAAHGLQYSDAVLLDDSPDNTGKYARLGFDRILVDSPDRLRSELEKHAYGT